MIKTYTSKYFYYSFYISFKGEIKNIVLQGGNSLAKTNGIFTTTDKELQDAIEQSNYFKKGIVKLKSSYCTTITEQPVQDITPEKKAVDLVASDIKAYPEVTTAQQAAKVLNKDYKVAFTQSNTKDKIFQKAKELNISFPNLK